MSSEDIPVTTIPCLLCGGLYIDNSYKEHLLHGHGVTVNMVFLLSVSEFMEENNSLVLTNNNDSEQVEAEKQLLDKLTKNNVQRKIIASNQPNVTRQNSKQVRYGEGTQMENVDDKVMEVNANDQQDMQKIKTASVSKSAITKCKLCYKKFITKSKLVDHYKREHIENSNDQQSSVSKSGLACPTISSQERSRFQTWSEPNYSVHLSPQSMITPRMSGQLGLKQVSTSTPVQPTQQSSDTEQKSKVRRRMGFGSLPCPQCGKKFYERHALRRHIRRFCKVTNTQSSFVGGIGLVQHQMAMSPTKVITDLAKLQSLPKKKIQVKVPFEVSQVCEHCGKIFPTDISKKIHIGLLHKQGTAACKFCEKTFTKEKNVKRHLKVCTVRLGNSSKPEQVNESKESKVEDIHPKEICSEVNQSIQVQDSKHSSVSGQREIFNQEDF